MRLGYMVLFKGFYFTTSSSSPSGAPFFRCSFFSVVVVFFLVFSVVVLVVVVWRDKPSSWQTVIKKSKTFGRSARCFVLNSISSFNISSIRSTGRMPKLTGVYEHIVLTWSGNSGDVERVFTGNGVSFRVRAGSMVNLIR